MTFYWYPKCGTCRKAKKWLDDHHLSYKEVHIVETPPSADELKKIHQLSGMDVKKFFNTSGQKYRELGIKDRIGTLSENELFELLSSDGMLIKRPLITDGENVAIGFKEEDYEAKW